MKMKEVCAATGLTERAVRFYVQEQLVNPQSQRRGGRTWLDFSEPDVERLRAIGILRKAGFTIDEIRSMGQDFPNNAPGAAFALRRRLQEAIDASERLRRIDTAQADGLESYASLLEAEVKDQPLPDYDGPCTRQIDIDAWHDRVEWLLMLGAVWLFWRLYNGAVDLLSDRFTLLSIAFWNPLVYFLLFVILPLPIAIVLGSGAGKWLCRHFEYVPCEEKSLPNRQALLMFAQS